MPLLLSLAALLTLGAEPTDPAPSAVLAPVRVAATQESNLRVHPLPPEYFAAKINHLEAAADHLQAAGLTDEAEMVRERAHAERLTFKRTLLAAKRQQLIALQKEIDALTGKADPDENRNVMVRLSLVEVDEESWQESLEPVLSENISHKLDTDSDYEAIVFRASEDWRLTIDALTKEKQAKRLAEPNLATLNGVECAIHSGGEVPAIVDVDGEKQIKNRPFGVNVRLCPQLGEDDEIDLTITAQYDAATPDPAGAMKGVTPFVVENRFQAELKAAIEKDESLVIVSPAVESKAGDANAETTSVRTILVIHPEAMKPVVMRKQQIRR